MESSNGKEILRIDLRLVARLVYETITKLFDWTTMVAYATSELATNRQPSDENSANEQVHRPIIANRDLAAPDSP